jgi:hypothetical protein
MVINKMTWRPARDDRIQAYLSVLDSLVSMLNAQEGRLPKGARRQRRPTGRSEFQVALLDYFDRWIETGKTDAFSKGEKQLLRGDTLRHHLDDDGIARFSLDFRFPDGAARPLQLKDQAEMWFRLFLARDGRRLLSKCSECGRYFLRKRLPKRGVDLKHGEFCSDHRSQIRIRSTRMNRRRELDRRVLLIAKLRTDWNSKRRAMSCEKWVVAQFNRQYREDRESPMTQAWITRHKKEIVLESAKLKRA